MSTVVLIQAAPFNPATAAPVPVRLAGGGAGAYTQLGFTDWRSGVANLPRITTALDFDQSGWTGGAIPQASTIKFFPSDRALLSTLANLFWTGAPITITVGDDEAPNPVYTTLLAGTVGAITSAEGAITITVSDLSGKLAVAAAPDTFAGTGGLEGGDSAIGNVKRRSWGRCWNIEGRVLDAANNVYEFGDPSRPWQAFDRLKDKGREGPITLVAWQGSAAATLAYLANAVAPQGGGVVAPSIACAKWWTTPSGPLTADIRGEIGAGYVETPAEMTAAIVAAYSTLAIANVPTAKGWRPGPAGIHVSDSGETVGAVLDRLLLPVSLLWVLDAAGTISFRQWTWDAPVETVVAVDKIERTAVYQPLKDRKLGYQLNNRVHTDGEISAAVLGSDVTYNDGTPIEDLKPAQPGADVTGDNTSADTRAVAQRPAADIINDLDLNGQNWFDLTAAFQTRDALMLARTTLQGQDIGTYVTSLTTQFQDDKTAYAESFDYLGAKVGSAEAEIFDVRTVFADATSSYARQFQSITATLGDQVGTISDLKEVVIGPEGTNARAVLALNVNGKLAGIVNTNDGTISRFEASFDSYTLLGPDGNSLFYASGTTVRMPNVEVDTLKANIVTTDKIVSGSVTALTSMSFADQAIGTSEVTLAEVSFVCGDAIDGRALVDVSFTQDSSTQQDTAITVRAYVDLGAGAGYQKVRDFNQGIVVSNASGFWILPVGFPIPVLGSGSVKVKVTAQGYGGLHGSYSTGSYARGIIVNIFAGAR